MHQLLLPSHSFMRSAVEASRGNNHWLPSQSAASLKFETTSEVEFCVTRNHLPSCLVQPRVKPPVPDPVSLLKPAQPQRRSKLQVSKMKVVYALCGLAIVLQATLVDSRSSFQNGRIGEAVQVVSAPLAAGSADAPSGRPEPDGEAHLDDPELA